MGERDKDLREKLRQLEDTVGRLQEDLDEEEALDLLEKAVDEAEKCGKSLEEEG